MKHGPSRVQGLVLIESAHEDQFRVLPCDFVTSFRLVPIIFSCLRWLAPMGLIRFWTWIKLCPFPPLFLYPADAQAEAVNAYSQV